MFFKRKKWILLSILTPLLIMLIISIFYVSKVDWKSTLYDTAWSLNSKGEDGGIIYDTYFFSKKNIYRVLGAGSDQSFVIYNILRQDKYDYRVVVLKAHINPKHSDIVPAYGHGTITVVDVRDDKLFIGHKINNKFIPQYYSGFYRQ